MNYHDYVYEEIKAEYELP